MSNLLTALAPVLYTAAQTVSNEPYGFLRAISLDYNDEGVAKGDTLYVPVAPVRALTDFVPAAVTVQGDDSTPTNVAVKITFAKKASWYLTGEQIRSLQNGGVNGVEMARQWLLQGMRTLRNYAEADAATQIKAGASRAYGTAGTTPFGTDLSPITNLLKMMKDNGAPMADPQIVVNTAAGLNLRNLGIVQNVYQAGSDQERRTGNFLEQFGYTIRESAGVGLHTPGTGTSYVTSGTTAQKTQAVALVTGSGTVLAGDVVTFAADAANKYIAAGDPSAALLSAPGTFNLGRPGVIPAAGIATANAMTIGGAYTANIAFERSAVMGVYRPPIMPENPTITQLKITDQSGLTFLLCEIAQYGQLSWELHLAGGAKVVQQEHCMVLMG